MNVMILLLLLQDKRGPHNLKYMQQTIPTTLPTSLPDSNTRTTPVPPFHQFPVHPEAIFDSPEEAQATINLFTRDHGYAVIRLRRVLDKNSNIRRVVLACDRHGVYKPSKSTPGTKKRNGKATKKCDCPMRMHLVREVSTSSSTCAWRIEYRGGESHHNHEPSMDPSSHTMHRRFDRTDEVIEAIVTDANTSITAAQTLVQVRQNNPQILLRKSDIYNAKRKETLKRIGCNTRTQHLLNELQKNGDYYRHRLDMESRLSHLFFAIHEVLDVFKANYDIIMMDCTYKTNKFGMPLLNFIGVSGMNTTLHLAHCFMAGESTDDYTWALTTLKECLSSHAILSPSVILVDRDLALLNALDTSFPNVPALLCLWHVVKAVETHARRTFQKVPDISRTNSNDTNLVDSPQHRKFCDTFISMIRATTEESYNQYHAQLWEMSREEAQYIDETWLFMWKR
ncbi:hypothetical protein Ae201684P_010581 [Aphanomyces euteiches]|uniref:MULE transposase domain-containing protein n=1 Tax=Aphanomyces euteiches TaxID=100861 RepID=A0A6G0WI59_9STRA|nr:hypothetical protein Ae201684_015011 [Aphanomyces euteiches]KAH9076641.1 hypothetical protein Ae201684P_010581 [Aphanomyces euteiches]